MQETRDKLLQKENQELMQKLHREAAEREVWKNRQNARLEKERIAKECKEQERLAQLKEWKEVLAIRNSASVFPPPPSPRPRMGGRGGGSGATRGFLFSPVYGGEDAEGR